MSITDFFHETAIKDGVAKIIQDDFDLKLGPEQMEHVTNLVMDKLEHMPAVTEGEDPEVDMFYYLLYTMLHNITLQAKLKFLDEAS